MNTYFEVAIDTPLRQVFDYRVPQSIDASTVQAGMRVRVPFGRRRMLGIVLAVKSTTNVQPQKLKYAIELLDDTPIFAPTLLGLLLWSADYYRHPVGAVLAAALPAALRNGAPQNDARLAWRLNEQGRAQWNTRLSKRGTRLRTLANALQTLCDAEALAAIHSDWRAALRDLTARGWVDEIAVDEIMLAATTVRHSAESTHTQNELTLSDEQRNSLHRILEASNQFRTWLLHGVTGSGKTEVYLQAIDAVIANGKQALVLVPEIALTPQLVNRFQTRFATSLAVLHSGLNEGEKLQAWRAARSGTASIVIGTRSAIFAPSNNLGIIIVDEEHDPSYKQQEGFRYSARDLAIARAQRHGIPVVLGSATPSLESLARVKKQPGDLLTLPQRAGNARPPQARLIDLHKHGATDGIATPTILSIQEHLRADGQVLLYLNRRGFAPALFCVVCGWSAACSRCDARMTVHRASGKLTCHHCGLEAAIPENCAACNAPAKPVGQGTERIETTVEKLFPGFAVARIDRDSTRRKGELQSALSQVASGITRILIGTQMLTKGHHFPNVTLVVVLNADQGLFGTDFRASERLAQNIVQVAGRAGRAERAGEVLIQTEYPAHPLLGYLLRDGYYAFAEQALQEREQAHWPPYARIALLRAEASSMNHAMNFLITARDRAKQLRSSTVRILGPVSAPMARRAGRYRAQLLLHANTHAPLQKLLSTLLPQLEALPETKRVRWSIDVDPLELF